MSIEQTELPPPRISTQAGLSTHPGVIEEFREVLAANDGAGRMAHTAAVKALTAVQESITDIVAAKKAMESPLPEHRIVAPDGSIAFAIPEQKKAEVADAMSQSFRRGSKLLDDAHNIIDQATAAVETRIYASLTNSRRNEAGVAAIATQIRDLVRSMPAAERIPFVRKAALEGDLEIVSAIFAASPFVSGLTRQQLADLKADAEEAFAPAEVQQRNALAGMKQRLSVAGSAYLNRYSAMVPRPNAAAEKGAQALAKLRGKAA